MLQMAADNIGHFPLNCDVRFTLISMLTVMTREYFNKLHEVIEPV